MSDDFSPPTQESIWKVTRQLKKEQSSLYNCCASVLSDAAFVSEVRALYPALPLLANLRCGLWYTRQVDGTCYFKSTDGHSGNWSFSSTRINWHVCEVAAKQGGVIIVDATRKGKRFPDALTKTIPIWAAVVNRAVARKRAEHAAQLAAPLPQPDGAPVAKATASPRTTVELQFQVSSPAQSPRCGHGGSATASGDCIVTPALPNPWTTPIFNESESVSSCARVGSLSQWLQSPIFAAVSTKEQDAALPLLDPHPAALQAIPLSCPMDGAFTAGDAVATDHELVDMEMAAVLAAVAAAASAPGPMTSAGSFCPELCELELLQREASFGDVDDAVGSSSHSERSDSPLQTLTMEAATHHNEYGVPDHVGPFQRGISSEGEGEAPTTAAALPLLSMSSFANNWVSLDATSEMMSARNASRDVPNVGPAAAANTASAPASDPSAGECRCSMQRPPGESSDFVDLGAASAAHVSCSPEEAWQHGGLLYGGVVDDSHPDLCLRYGGSWERPLVLPRCDHCPPPHYRGHGTSSFALPSQEQDQLTDLGLHVQEQRVRQWQLDRTGSCQRLSSGLVDSDLDADCSGGSCSEKCLPNGLGSNRSSSSSSSSSLHVSRSSSSCSSDHSELAAGVVPDSDGGSDGRSGGKSCVGDAESPLQMRLIPPRPHSCLRTMHAPRSPSKLWRCSALPLRPAGGLISNSSRDSAIGSSVGDASDKGGGSGSSDCASSCSWGISASGHATEATYSSEGGSGGTGDGGDAAGWDVGLHLPLWISANERAQIERRLDSWVEALLRIGADVDGLAKMLHKPLRPLWISQSSTIWVDQVAQPDQLPFTPLYLVSASQPHSYVRQVGCCVSGIIRGSDTDSDSNNRATAVRLHPKKYRQDSEQRQQQPHTWSYVYVPGAGDDEESWAAGLTPAVFWTHYTELLQAGPAGVYDAVRHILHREAAALAECGVNSSIQTSVAADSYSARTDQHHLLPAGCRGGTCAAGSAAPGPSGLLFIGPTGIALGDLGAGAAPGCWNQVDAVLNCGAQQHPSMLQEKQWPPAGLHDGRSTGQEAGSGARGNAVVRTGKSEVCLGLSYGFTFPPSSGCSSGGARPCSSTSPSGDPVEPNLHRHQYHRCCQDRQLHVVSPSCSMAPRYLHLPVEHSKMNRSSLIQYLDPALEFLSYHLSRGRRVLIHDTNGMCTCVCVLVALLLACYSPCGNSSGGESNVPVWSRCYQAGSSGSDTAANPGPISKDDVRQRLAYVSSFYLPARPTRGMLRQVFNHFMRAKGGVENP